MSSKVGPSESAVTKESSKKSKKANKNKNIATVNGATFTVSPSLGKIFDGNTLTCNRKTGKPKDTGLSKVIWAAASANPRNIGPAGLAGFQQGELTAAAFNEQMRRSFGVRFTPAELQAVVDYFDTDKSGTVDGAEFLVSFFKLGFAEKEAQKAWRKKAVMKIENRANNHQAEKERKQQEWANAQVDWNFTEADRQSSIHKFAQAALAYMRNGTRVTGLAGLRGFQGSAMQPMEFRENVKQAFGVHLTKKELGALVQEVDLDKNGTIDGAEFLCYFFKLGRKTEQAIAEKNWYKWKRQALLDEIKENKRKEREAQKLGKQLSNWSQEDQDSAVMKIKTAAAMYTRRNLGPAQLGAFDGNAMPPELFARRIFSTFGVRLTQRELGALVCWFDKDADGTIDSTEFMARFFQMKSKSYLTNPMPTNFEVHGPDGGGGWTFGMPPHGKAGPLTAELFETKIQRVQSQVRKPRGQHSWGEKRGIPALPGSRKKPTRPRTTAK